MTEKMEDFLPLANNSIYALTINPDRDEIYGVTYPDGHFFIYNIAASKTTDLGAIDSQKVYHGPERQWRTLSRALVCDDSGRVFYWRNLLFTLENEKVIIQKPSSPVK